MEARDSLPASSPDSADRTTAPPDDGVDVTLVRWMLGLTPRERLEVLQSSVRSLEILRGAACR